MSIEKCPALSNSTHVLMGFFFTVYLLMFTFEILIHYVQLMFEKTLIWGF